MHARNQLSLFYKDKDVTAELKERCPEWVSAGNVAKAAAANPKKPAKQEKADTAKAKTAEGPADTEGEDVPDPGSAGAVKAAATVAGIIGLASVPGVNCYTNETVHVNSGCLHTCNVWQADASYDHRCTALPAAQANPVLPFDTSATLSRAQANPGLPRGSSQVRAELPDVPKIVRQSSKSSIGAFMKTAGFSIFAMLSCVSDIVLELDPTLPRIVVTSMFPTVRPSKAMPPSQCLRVLQQRLQTH